MAQQINPSPADLRALIKKPAPVRCYVNEQEVYEVTFDVLAREGPGGSTLHMSVSRSTDGGRTWKTLRLRRNWRAQWWLIVKDGMGGGWWPPAGDYFKDAYIKDGRIAIAYWNLHEFGPKGQAFVWEMQYDPGIDRWNLALLEEVWPS